MLKIETLKVFSGLAPTGLQISPKALAVNMVTIVALIAMFCILEAIHDIVVKKNVVESIIKLARCFVVLFLFAYFLAVVFLLFTGFDIYDIIVNFF